MAVVYFFGAIAKLNGVWLRGEPMTIRLSPYAEAFSISERALGHVFSYGVLRRVPSRQCRAFDIGIFPWLATAATTLFLGPSRPRYPIHALRRDEGEDTGRWTDGSPPSASLLGGRFGGSRRRHGAAKPDF
jgi:hypothetical protein